MRSCFKYGVIFLLAVSIAGCNLLDSTELPVIIDSKINKLEFSLSAKEVINVTFTNVSDKDLYMGVLRAYLESFENGNWEFIGTWHVTAGIPHIIDFPVESTYSTTLQTNDVFFEVGGKYRIVLHTLYSRDEEDPVNKSQSSTETFFITP